jgi:hypothetical protein
MAFFMETPDSEITKKLLLLYDHFGVHRHFMADASFCEIRNCLWKLIEDLRSEKEKITENKLNVSGINRLLNMYFFLNWDMSRIRGYIYK